MSSHQWSVVYLTEALALRGVFRMREGGVVLLVMGGADVVVLLGGGLLFLLSLIRILRAARDCSTEGVGGWFDSIDWGVVDTADWGVGGAVVAQTTAGVGVDGVSGGGGERTEVEPGVVGAEPGAGDINFESPGARWRGGGVGDTTWAIMFELEPLLPDFRRSLRFTAFSIIEVQSRAESGTSV